MYSTGVRESFLDKIEGPNENRFVLFNSMPGIFSKYKKSEQPPCFGKQVDRAAAPIGMEEGGLDGKKEKFLQDYSPDHEYPKRPLSSGRKLLKLIDYRYRL